MAERDKKGQFKKGNPGGGRKPLPDDVKKIRNISYEEMCRTVIKVRGMNPAQIKDIDMEKIPLGERVIINAYVKLDYKGIKDYEDRLWGKAVEIRELYKHSDSDRSRLEHMLETVPEEVRNRILGIKK